MQHNIEKKIESNRWLVKIRWLSLTCVLMIGFIIKVFSPAHIAFPFYYIVSILLLTAIVNFLLYLFFNRAKETISPIYLNIVSYGLVIIELAIYTIILQLAGGAESIVLVFFCLAIVSSALIFSLKGAIITAISAGVLVNLVMLSEYFGYIPYINLYGIEVIEFKKLTTVLTRTTSFTIFYLAIGVFFGLLSKFLSKRESLLEERTEKLNKATELGGQAHKELDAKVKHLERSEKSLLRAFGDIQAARQKIEEEKDKTEAIINNFIDPIIVLDENKKITLFNPASQRIFGLDDQDLGKEVSEKDNFSMENFKEILGQDIKVKKVEDVGVDDVMIEEASFKRGQRDLTYKVITAKVINDRNQYLGTMKIFYDVTREKTIDKLKSEFISICAHQLRTPLSAIKWVIKMVLDGDVGRLNKEQQELLDKGYKSNERMIKLVNDLLNVSRIEEGRFGYTFKKYDFQEIINTAVENIESLIAKNHIRFTVVKPRKMPKVFVDKEKMILVMQNLLDNAIKYTPEHGKIEINVKVMGKFLRVGVKDNGVGIPEKDKSKIFSKFFRATNVIRMQTEGSGLGLFIVKNVIEKHGGVISVASNEGEGTEVNFTLPH